MARHLLQGDANPVGGYKGPGLAGQTRKPGRGAAHVDAWWPTIVFFFSFFFFALLSGQRRWLPAGM